ncbi:hypothetical protein N7G274_006677 [Stereocaulon virgatum]|uniref:Telomeric single stranded DNA binding POT1/Cdc13 domain-containing protein n=1 Tax=Stereocaulon virgatum TaxID=373712 RepID=A0ABR4A6N4_9LECA
MAALTTLPIAQLQPGLDSDSTSVFGIVTLIWPYASSTHTLSLLLVEPDFRLRRHRGQVRVHFQGSSAKALSRAEISIGDQLLLNLTGVQWAKDTFAASTPGRGIDWELRYGERAVLRLHRADQDVTSLDIDHPALSSEFPIPTSTPRLSPPYNSHIPTTTRKLWLNSQAWESPAFLKRSHLPSSHYDPFAEEEFPDNERSKKTKFGRGSGQWRFAERTPSPDKELNTSTFDVTSPSKIQTQDGSPVEDLTSAAQTFRDEVIDDEQTANEVAGEDTSQIVVIRPPSPTPTDVEPANSEMTGELPPIERVLPAVLPQFIYSTSVTSESDQDSDSEDGSGYQPEDSGTGAISGQASDLGLDGSAYSRAQQLLKATPDTRGHVQEVEVLDDVKKEFEKDQSLEMSSRAESKDDAGVPEAAELPSTIKESAPDFMVVDDSDSERDTQHVPSSLSSSSDQLEDEQPLHSPVSSEGEGSSEKDAPRSSIDEALGQEGEELKVIEQQQVIVHDLESIQARGIPVQRIKNSTEIIETKQSNVEIIDLGSEDEEESDGQTSPGADAQVSVSLKPNTADSLMPEKGFTTISPIGASSLEGHKTAETRALSPPTPGDEQKIALRPGTADQQPLIEEQTPSSRSPRVDVQPRLLSAEELPATIQETYDDPISKSHPMTPSDTQGSAFVSQLSFTSAQTLADLETLPTPRLTQATSAGIEPPEQLSTSASQEPPDLQEAPSVEEESSPVEVKPSTPRKAPNLIDKLRAMRKLSGQSSRLSSETTATSPWFAPRRSSQVVPDSEVESEVESSSEKEQPTQLTAAPTGQITEKPKPLSASLIRSTPQRTTAASIASSPGYLPPSQPPPPGFRTHLSYFVPLATLPQHFTTTVDVLAIAIDSTQVARATSGPRDYNKTIYITDPSSSKLQPPMTRAQIFRSYNNCFPVLDPGDAIMLREFRVQSFQRQMTLLSTQSSSWAVFRKGAGVQMRGPPVELGAEERLFARGLWRWWDGLKNEERMTLKEVVPKEEPKSAAKIALTKGGEAGGRTDETDNGETAKSKIKQEGINGLRITSSTSQSKTRNAPLKERSVDVDGTTDNDRVMESTEPPKRVLRPRGARVLPERSESPTKALNTRYGTVFTGGIGEPESD